MDVLLSFFVAICWMALGAVIGTVILMFLFACGVIKADDMAWENFLQKLENLRKNRSRNTK